MPQLCERVERALVSGPALLDEEAAHIESCESCAELASLGTSLGGAMDEAGATAPPLGFATRLIAQGHARIVLRRRRRIGFAMAGGLVSVAVLLLLLSVPGSSSEASSSGNFVGRSEVAPTGNQVGIQSGVGAPQKRKNKAKQAPSKAPSPKATSKSKSASKAKGPKAKGPKAKGPKVKGPKAQGPTAKDEAKKSNKAWQGPIHLVDPKSVHNGEFPASRCLACHRSDSKPRPQIDHPKIPTGKLCVDCHTSGSFESTPRSTLLPGPGTSPIDLLPAPAALPAPAEVCDEVTCLVHPEKACCKALVKPRAPVAKPALVPGQLFLTAAASSRIYLDGKYVAVTPTLLKKLKPGKYHLRAKPVGGGKTIIRIVHIKAGRLTKLKL